MILNQETKIYCTFKVDDIAFKCIPTYKYYKYLVTINMMNIKQVGSVFPLQYNLNQNYLNISQTTFNTLELFLKLP